MRAALLLLLLLAACEDTSRSSRHRDDLHESGRSYGGLGFAPSRSRRASDDVLQKMAEDQAARARELALQAEVEARLLAGADPSTGAWECDELIRMTRCMYDKSGNAVPPEARRAFEEGVKYWKQALDNDATRDATRDACKMSLDGARAGFDAVGCY